MYILVTVANGYIGSHICKLLNTNNNNNNKNNIIIS